MDWNFDLLAEATRLYLTGAGVLVTATGLVLVAGYLCGKVRFSVTRSGCGYCSACADREDWLV